MPCQDKSKKVNPDYLLVFCPVLYLLTSQTFTVLVLPNQFKSNHESSSGMSMSLCSIDNKQNKFIAKMQIVLAQYFVHLSYFNVVLDTYTP